MSNKKAGALATLGTAAGFLFRRPIALWDIRRRIRPLEGKASLGTSGADLLSLLEAHPSWCTVQIDRAQKPAQIELSCGQFHFRGGTLKSLLDPRVLDELRFADGVTVLWRSGNILAAISYRFDSLKRIASMTPARISDQG